MKCTQDKQIFSILYHIDCLSKYLHWLSIKIFTSTLIEAEIILNIYTSAFLLIFVLLSYAVYAVLWKIYYIVPKYENRF